jgi:hypothetical protein
MTMMTIITIAIGKQAIAEVETGRGWPVPPRPLSLDKIDFGRVPAQESAWLF